MTLLEKFKDFVAKLFHNLPEELKEAAEFAEPIISKAITIINSDSVKDFTAIVSDAEPLRNEILAILTGLDAILLKIEDENYKQGAYAKAGALITKLKEGGNERMNVYDLTFQNYYSKKTNAA